MSGSEIARLRDQIEQQCQSMNRIMTGYAVTASHKTIFNKYAAIGHAKQQLAELVGEEEATRIIVETYIHTIG